MFIKVVYKEGVLRNFAKFTGRHLCQGLFFNKVRPKTCSFIKKETLTQLFSREFCQISKKAFFTEHLRTTASRSIITFPLTCGSIVVCVDSVATSVTTKSLI